MKQYYITTEFDVNAENKEEALIKFKEKVKMLDFKKNSIEICDLKSYRIKEIEANAKQKYSDYCVDDNGWEIIEEVMDNLGTLHEYLVLQGKPHKGCDECIDTKEALIDDGIRFD